MSKQHAVINSFRGKHYFLSNFYEADVNYLGLSYQTVEAAFQAQKDLSRSHEFQNISPAESKRLGRRVRLRSDWNDIRITIMRDLLWAKFSQNPDLAQKLIETGDAQLIEGNSWNDTFWGISNNRGQNHLGKLLMDTREKLKVK